VAIILGKICLPADAKTTVAVGAYEKYVCFTGVPFGLERDMESVCVPAARAGIYLTFRFDFFCLICGSHFHKN